MGGRDSDGGGLWTPLCSGRIFELSGVPDWPLNPATSQPPFPEFVQSVNECVCLLWRAGWQAQVESFDGAKWQEEPPLLVRTSGAQALFAGEMLYVIGLCSFILCVIRLCSLTLNPNMRAFDSLSLSLSRRPTLCRRVLVWRNAKHCSGLQCAVMEARGPVTYAFAKNWMSATPPTLPAPPSPVPPERRRKHGVLANAGGQNSVLSAPRRV